MVASARRCQSIAEGGGPCRATPRRDRPWCFWHDPDTQQEAQEARRLGGLRRRREHAIGGAYDVDGVGTPAEILRVVEIAILDTLELTNSVARNRTLGSLAQTAQRILEGGELAAEVEALKTAVLPRLQAGRR